MNKRRTVKRAAVILLAAIFSIAWGQNGEAQYPTKPINMMVGFSVGGSTDLTVRALCRSASTILGQPIVVLNKPGSASVVALSLLKNEKPDGYTIGHLTIGGVLNQFSQKVIYDVMSDFVPIMGFGYYIAGVVVQAEAPWKTFKEMIDYAKANPGKIKFGSSGTGSIQFLVMEYLARQEGIQWGHIPFKSSHDAVIALLGGHINAAAATSDWKPHVEAGKLRLLSTYLPKRIPKYPGVPTWIDLGYNISASIPSGVVAPKGTPPSIVHQLEGAFKKATDDPNFIKTMETFDMPVAYMDREAFAQEIKGLCAQWGKFILQLGLRQE